MTAAEDVAIVGYGPVGQVTALLLAARGHRVTVVERWPKPYPMPRAVSFDGESARILAAAGIGGAMGAIAEPSRDYVWHNADGRTLFRVDVADPGHSGWPDSTSMYQPGLEAALADHGATLPTLRVLRGTRVTDLADHGDAVTLDLDGPGPDTLTARWVVGCDGANSLVRTRLGIPSTDFAFFDDWLTCDVALHAPHVFEPNNLQVCDPARPRTAVSAGPGHRRWEFMRLPDEDPDEFGTAENAWRLLARFGIDRATATLERHAVYTFQARYADEWRRGRVLIAGDAAHLMPPFAGQGMCSGFRDAANLAWKLDLVLAGRATPALLDTYTTERREHVRHALRMSMDLGRVICQTDPAKARDRDAVMLAAQERAARREVGAAQPRTPVQALTGGLLWHGADGRPTAPAGELVPQGRVSVDGAPAARFDDAVGRGFVLLTDRPTDTLLDTEQRRFLDALAAKVVHIIPTGTTRPHTTRDIVAEDTDGVYLPHLKASDSAALLIRPDFYTFGAARDHHTLKALLTRLQSHLTTPPP
ncbi:bifunctional 3-(3-hydroxy-phenyl)propionate/3-hydroxycinnamic acid hydroxylase [Yinghuangia sp. ASG 101]|uniref:bifunctional 3-(3-hydroxy-phenyl)propionate/3-hydroxycinnamic acid hydroxylase MhpA n=1 Tax=Yinghuangia sp. ASG 101 TaxID=2896848 RepID=UPI001E443DA2|nr:bifunctional 3-(3-hydroxy-phenyl)propionate/3-hydroxycinnamic acid hydroxylase [Yinghuangia sp. ASG 101]UGQ13418.1 bifunctional 3-(3-hydroxy-phenyl)propionate/3-hydroxycinnamic acid hydroxylase [Yinghuangia sp. ASG 101]